MLVFERGSGGHVGFAVGQDDTHFFVLGGNQSDAVTIARVAKSRLLGARWPATFPPRLQRLPTMNAGEFLTTTNDLAEAAAIILAEPSRFDGPTPPLTGAEALDLSDMAGIATDLSGRRVQRETITEEDQRNKMAARGVPGPVIEIGLGLYAASQKGEFAAVDPTLATLLGRPPVTMRDLIALKLRALA